MNMFLAFLLALFNLHWIITEHTQFFPGALLAFGLNLLFACWLILRAALYLEGK